jgi:hypothetical protein
MSLLALLRTEQTESADSGGDVGIWAWGYGAHWRCFLFGVGKVFLRHIAPTQYGDKTLSAGIRSHAVVHLLCYSHVSVRLVCLFFSKQPVAVTDGKAVLCVP